jgi:hypothetical protein
MPFDILFGIPEMDAFWNDLTEKANKNNLSKSELKLFRKLLKTFKFLSQDPQYNSLCSHEISSLSDKAGFKVFESYTENNTPSAGRVFWTYGPGKKKITILGYEPHPEDKKRGAYKRVKLSNLPPIRPSESERVM